MHKIYEDKGKFNFIYQIPQILYSTLMSNVCIILVKMVALSENNIIIIKTAKKEELSKIQKNEFCRIKCKFIFFFIFVNIFLFLFLYYIGCFCSVYKNTQIHLISDTIVSFSLSLIYPLFIYLIPGIFRIAALNSIKKNNEYLYNFSKIVQVFT